MGRARSISSFSAFITFILLFHVLLSVTHVNAEDEGVYAPRPSAKELTQKFERTLDEKRHAERMQDVLNGKQYVYVTTYVDPKLAEMDRVDIVINGRPVPDVLQNTPGKFSFIIPDDIIFDKSVRDQSILEIRSNQRIVRSLPISVITLSATKVEVNKFRAQIAQYNKEKEGEQEYPYDVPPTETAEHAGQEIDNDQSFDDSLSDEITDTPAPDEEYPSPASSSSAFEIDHHSVTEKKHHEDYTAFMKLMSEMQDQGVSRKSVAAIGAMAEGGNSYAMTNLASIYLAGDFDSVARNVTRGVKLLRAAAKTGNADAQAKLGFLYASGVYPTVVPKNVGMAILYWEFAAQGGSQYAKMALAFRYFTGTDVVEDCEMAALLYEEVAFNVLRAERKRVKDSLKQDILSNPALADVTPPTPAEVSGLGRTRLREDLPLQIASEHHDVIQYYQHAARRGDAHAQVVVGNLHYYGGAGVPQNLIQARKLFEKAASAGRMDAHAHLGFMDLRAGRNMSAVTHLTLAANNNHKMGHHGLGVLRLYGIGVDRNVRLAQFHFEKAAELKVPEAMYNLGLMLYEGSEEVERDMAGAYQRFVEAAHHGHQNARYMVGRMHLKGIPPALMDCSKASRQFKAVAEQGVWNKILGRALRGREKGEFTTSIYRYLQAAHAGIEVAQFNAAYMYDQALYTEISDDNTSKAEKERLLNNALELYKMSAAQGAADGAAQSMLRVGDLLYSEKKDFEQAAIAYQKAGRFQNAEALFNLGIMHATGKGLKLDKHMAKRYLDHAKLSDSKAAIPTAIALLALRYSDDIRYVVNKAVYVLEKIGVGHPDAWNLLSTLSINTPTTTSSITTTSYTNKKYFDLILAYLNKIKLKYNISLGPDGILIGLLLFALALIVNARHRLQVARRQQWEEEEEEDVGDDNEMRPPPAQVL